MIETSTIQMRRLDGSRKHSIDYLPSGETQKQMAGQIGLRKLRLEPVKGELTPHDKGWNLTLAIKGVATQACVISGAPIHQPLELHVHRDYQEDAKDLPEEMSWDLEFDVDQEPLPQNLELDDVIAESILLELPEFPRLKKYQDEEIFRYADDSDTDEVETQKPFANLKALLEQKKSGES